MTIKRKVLKAFNNWEKSKQFSSAGKSLITKRIVTKEALPLALKCIYFFFFSFPFDVITFWNKNVKDSKEENSFLKRKILPQKKFFLHVFLFHIKLPSDDFIWFIFLCFPSTFSHRRLFCNEVKELRSEKLKFFYLLTCFSSSNHHRFVCNFQLRFTTPHGKRK